MLFSISLIVVAKIRLMLTRNTVDKIWKTDFSQPIDAVSRVTVTPRDC